MSDDILERLTALERRVEQLEARPGLRYHGVYRTGHTYLPGDAVTWAGSLWIACCPTKDRPGDGPTGWKLAVKAGRDGKERG